MRLDMSDLASELEALATQHSEFLDERDEIAQALENFPDEPARTPDYLPLTADEKARMSELTEFQNELGCDLGMFGRNGGIIVLEGDWVQYSREYASDVGYIRRDHPMYDFIDWEEYANSLLCDYDEINFEGESYYYQTR